MTPKHYDLLVMGNGPAGTAAALTAAAGGMDVAVLGAAHLPANTDRIGESLSVAAKPILKELGLWQVFLADHHAPCHGNTSAWGSSQLQHYDSLYDLRGHGQILGWHLDRNCFEKRLQEKLKQENIEQSTLFPRSITRSSGLWTLASPKLTTPWVIDASGRTARFARRHGAKRVQDDKQQAIIAYLTPQTTPIQTTASLVETIPEGWWYSAPLPDGRLVTALFTQPGQPWKKQQQSLSNWWIQNAQSSNHTAKRICQYQLPCQWQRSPAGSAHLSPFAGAGWLAAGDAALSYDPLSAHGITTALASGRDAAKALLAGGESAGRQYAVQLEAIYGEYLQQLRRYYWAERRWFGAAYWLARREALGSGH